MEENEFEIFQGKDSLWYWHLKAPNGEIVASSEGYTRRFDAERGTEDMKKEIRHLGDGA